MPIGWCPYARKFKHFLSDCKHAMHGIKNTFNCCAPMHCPSLLDIKKSFFWLFTKLELLVVSTQLYNVVKWLPDDQSRLGEKVEYAY